MKRKYNFERYETRRFPIKYDHIQRVYNDSQIKNDRVNHLTSIFNSINNNTYKIESAYDKSRLINKLKNAIQVLKNSPVMKIHLPCIE